MSLVRTPRDWQSLASGGVRRRQKWAVSRRANAMTRLPPGIGRCRLLRVVQASHVPARFRCPTPTRLPSSSPLIPTPHTMAAESPASVATAREGEPAFLTPPSTTQTSRNSSTPANAAPPARYRQAARLPFELAHHCSVYLESGQCIALWAHQTTSR